MAARLRSRARLDAAPPSRSRSPPGAFAPPPPPTRRSRHLGFPGLANGPTGHSEAVPTVAITRPLLFFKRSCETLSASLGDGARYGEQGQAGFPGKRRKPP